MKEIWVRMLTKGRSSPLLTGTALLFVSMTIVNGGNYLFNLILGRWLGPAYFADLSLLVTLMLMMTFITITFQLTAAKFAAAYTAQEDVERLLGMRLWLARQAWIWGGLFALILILGAPFWQQFFHTVSMWPFIILGVGIPVYLAQGVERGMLQGQMRFSRLALSYQAEMVVRLLGGLLMVFMGWGVNGAVAAMSLSFLASWLVAKTNWQFSLPTIFKRLKLPAAFSKIDKRVIIAFSVPVIVTQLSQILINNSDILIVKRYFPPIEAGQYAALALIGRIVFFATWSVTTALFPIVAQKQQKKENHRYLLVSGLTLVGSVSAVIILMAWWQPTLIIDILFGAAYQEMAPLLWLYAVATGIYSLANVVINYRLSADNSFGAYIGVAGGIAQVICLSIWHDSLQQVIFIQIGLMSTLLFVLLLWDSGLQYIAKRSAHLTYEPLRG